MSRDDFTAKTKEVLAKRVGYKCSNPNCRRLTIGPKSGERTTLNMGIAAHITAASSGGPRYDATMSASERSDYKNGIWLCLPCSTIIDKEEVVYSAQLLHEWKKQAEEKASDELINSTNDDAVKTTARIFVKKWDEFPELYENKIKNGMDVMFLQAGGVIERGDRWINYLGHLDEWQRPYVEAIRIDVVNKNIKITGKEYQDANQTPRFNNDKIALFTWRAWGDLMAAIWAEEENTNYSYLDFYM